MLQKTHELVMQDLNTYSKNYVANLYDWFIFILQLLCTYVEGAKIVMSRPKHNYQQFISDPKVPKKCINILYYSNASWLDIVCKARVTDFSKCKSEVTVYGSLIQQSSSIETQ